MNSISNKTILFIFIFTLIFVAFAKHHNSEDDDKVKIPYHEYSAPRVYAIADLHGDYNVAIRALKLARLINDVTWDLDIFTPCTSNLRLKNIFFSKFE